MLFKVFSRLPGTPLSCCEVCKEEEEGAAGCLEGGSWEAESGRDPAAGTALGCLGLRGSSLFTMESEFLGQLRYSTSSRMNRIISSNSRDHDPLCFPTGRGGGADTVQVLLDDDGRQAVHEAVLLLGQRLRHFTSVAPLQPLSLLA